MPPAEPKPTRPPPAREPILHDDGKTRCHWPAFDPLYLAYHDAEWGVPEYDDRALFEKLVLDGFQAGLSWITILRKRPAFRLAFDGFDPETVARYDAAKVASLMGDAGIVRNKAKIEGTITGARAWLTLRDSGGFAHFLWSLCDGRPKINRFRHGSELPVESPTSQAMSKALKARGFNFCGPTIVYAFMQAVGMVDDHLVDCHRHAECAALGAAGFTRV